MMKITPIDINQKNFPRQMMGYDVQQVNEFLQQVASQMESLLHERNHLRETLREKELQILEYKERDKVLKDTISTATQMSDRLRGDAEREARLITADAQQRADLITRDAKDSLRKIYQEVAELKKARLQFESNLKALAQAHLSLLEQAERYMPQMQLPNYNFANTTGSDAELKDQSLKSQISPLSSLGL
jgi:cell division initiation protein